MRRGGDAGLRGDAGSSRGCASCACRFKRLNDVNSSHYALFHSGSRWLSFLLDFIAALVTLFVTLLVVLSDNAVISPSLKGLALSYTIQVRGVRAPNVRVGARLTLRRLQLTGTLQYVVRLGTELQARFSSVERLLEYAEVRPAPRRHGDAYEPAPPPRRVPLVPRAPIRRRPDT